MDNSAPAQRTSAAGGARRRWSLQPEDLSDDWGLKGCPEIEFEGTKRRSLGRIVLLARLGKGAMGIVYYGVNPRLHTEVAVKVLPRALLEQEQGLVDRFEQEARFAAQIRSDHLVGVLDVDEDPSSGCHFIVMEYVKGISAAGWRNEVAPRTPEAQALDVCIAATKGLAAAHAQGIVHRDVKPDNILIPHDAVGRPVFQASKLADLGIARGDAGDGSLTGTRMAMGTPGYLAPEQARDAKRAKSMADVFGMGATLYALLTGRAPFAGTSPSDSLIRTFVGKYPAIETRRADLNPLVVALVGKCLEKEAERRYADAAELLVALETCRAEFADAPPPTASLGGSPITHQPTGRFASIGHGTPGIDDRETAQAESADPGLFITSSPSGATVQIDGKERGRTPLVIQELAEGRHAVRISLESHAPHMRHDVDFIYGAHTEIHARLQAIVGGIAVRDGVPGAHVQLIRQGKIRMSYPFVLDTEGMLEDTEVEVGTYRIVVSCPGYEAHEETFEIDRDQTKVVMPRMAEHEGGFSVDSSPPSAEVFVDDEAIGEAPIFACYVAPGAHILRLEVPGYEPQEVQVTVEAQETVHVGVIELARWGQIDLSALASGVVASLDGEPLSSGDPVPSTPVEVILQRSGYAPQFVSVAVPAGQSVAVSEPRPWAEMQAILDLTAVPWDVTCRVGEKEVFGSVAFVSNQEMTVDFEKPGHETQHVTVEVKLGERASARPGTWKEHPGFLDLSGLASGVVAECNGRRVKDGDPLLPGRYDLQLLRPGYVDQKFDIQVVAMKPVKIEIGEWERSVVCDLGEWDRARSAQRLVAAERIAERLPGFEFVEMEQFSAGERAHAVAIYVHAKTGMEFALLPAAGFQMGSAKGQGGAGELQHRVRLTEPLLIARTQVTQRVWDTVMDENPSWHKGGDLPVEKVSYEEATEFCRKVGLQLPTEAQWEYACRAGTSTEFCFGDDIRSLTDYGWFEGNADAMAHVVAQKLPNAFGLYDMHGNVWEWCSDGYGEYAPTMAIDPLGMPGATEFVMRGGSWNTSGWFARSAYRRKGPSGKRMLSASLRPARSVRAY